MKKGLTANQLKLIAIVAMTFDHLVWTLFPGYDPSPLVLLAHIPGRLTAPIMWFFIAEGYHHTRNVRKYAMRLLILAVISHFAYNFCFGIPFLPNGIFNQTGVVWSLFWGLILLWAMDKGNLKPWQQVLLIAAVCILTFPCDWSCIAAMAVLGMGEHRGNFPKQAKVLMFWTSLYALVYALFLDPLYGVLQLATWLTIPLLRLYNGQKGTWKPMGRLFYIYYPAHLFLCGLLRLYLIR